MRPNGKDTFFGNLPAIKAAGATGRDPDFSLPPRRYWTVMPPIMPFQS
jgi:hypothetical protein